VTIVLYDTYFMHKIATKKIRFYLQHQVDRLEDGIESR